MLTYYCQLLLLKAYQAPFTDINERRNHLLRNEFIIFHNHKKY